jgi:hypothetical protein
MNILVIHPNDPTTQFLTILYKDLQNVVKLDEHNSNKEIVHEIKSNKYDLIMMLGHGGEDGLYAPNGQQQFGRSIINPTHVQFLRDKLCFGIWCNANIFADKYYLDGIFSGMVISELYEASMWNIPVKDQEELTNHTKLWTEVLHDAFHYTGMKNIPQFMSDYVKDKKDITLLEDFNFNSIYYYIKGECQ